MAILGRLSTKDRLFSWRISTHDVCFMLHAQESHSHLFFAHPYTARVWDHFLEKYDIGRAGLNLPNEADWAFVHRRNHDFGSLIVKLSLAAVIYGKWCERKRRIFQQLSLSSMEFISKTVNDPRASISSWGHVKNMSDAKID